MKINIIIFFVLISYSLSAQKYFTRTGTTEFRASVAAFEPIMAKNNSTTVILVSNTGDIACQLFITAFRFPVSLMEEHFNENYMESNIYPKATFRGKLIDFDKHHLEDEYLLNGTITIKGIKKEIKTLVKIEFVNNSFKMSSTFTLQPKDFEIEIPNIVSKKIAEKINITFNYELSEKK